MLPLTQWTELSTQQLVRYEALFSLLDDILISDDISAISQRTASQWKYFANVASWRMVIFKENGYLVIDGFRGEAQLVTVQSLSPWDEYHWIQHRPCLLQMDDQWEGPEPPKHLTGKFITEIMALPIERLGQQIALLSTAARHVPFNELDKKFIRLFGSHFASRVSDITLRQQAMDSLLSMATRDALTGLLNRRAIIEHLENRLANSQRTGQPLSIILADIDYFKSINDKHGHLAGDEVLRETSRRLLSQTRHGDMVGRFGGEEFIFVLYPCSQEAVSNSAERFRDIIAETAFSIDVESATDLTVTISLGTVSPVADVDVGIQELIKQADQALYSSKANGRNCVTAYECL